MEERWPNGTSTGNTILWNIIYSWNELYNITCDTFRFLLQAFKRPQASLDEAELKA